MRIGVDATPVWGPPVGHYTYMVCLVRHLLALDPAHELHIYCRKEVPEAFRSLRDRARFTVFDLANRKLCEQWAIPRAARADRLDGLHMCWSHPLLYRGRSVVTVHGIEWLTHPGVPIHSRVNQLYYSSFVRMTCRRATRIIAISEFIKQAFMEHMGVAEDRIDVVHHGVDTDRYFRVTEEPLRERVRERYGLPERFVLFVGAMVANKNLDRLLRSFQRVAKERACRDVGLVIVGGEAWNSRPLQERARELGLEDRLTFTGYVPDEDLRTLYSLARVYAFPSLVEGFGLPVLESFACGTPVVTSKVTAMPEVAGDAALLVDPLDEEELAGALFRALTEEELRRELVRKGYERAQQFTWERTAQRTLAVYEKAFGRPSGPASRSG